VGVTTNNHPFPLFEGNTRVERPSHEVPRDRLFLIKEALYIFDSLPQEKILVFVSDKETNIPFLGQGEVPRSCSTFEHVGSAGNKGIYEAFSKEGL